MGYNLHKTLFPFWGEVSKMLKIFFRNKKVKFPTLKTQEYV